MNAPVAYLLDTNVVSEMMRRRPSPRVTACLDGIAGDGIGISSITVWEILNGIRRLDPGRRRDDLGDRFQGMLDEIFDRRVFDWTTADAVACANVMETKRRRGEPLDDHLPDAMIAGTANLRWSRSFGQLEGFIKVYSGCEITPSWSSSPYPVGGSHGRRCAGCR